MDTENDRKSVFPLIIENNYLNNTSTLLSSDTSCDTSRKQITAIDNTSTEKTSDDIRSFENLKAYEQHSTMDNTTCTVSENQDGIAQLRTTTDESETTHTNVFSMHTSTSSATQESIFPLTPLGQTTDPIESNRTGFLGPGSARTEALCPEENNHSQSMVTGGMSLQPASSGVSSEDGLGMKGWESLDIENLDHSPDLPLEAVSSYPVENWSPNGHNRSSDTHSSIQIPESESVRSDSPGHPRCAYTLNGASSVRQEAVESISNLSISNPHEISSNSLPENPPESTKLQDKPKAMQEQDLINKRGFSQDWNSSRSEIFGQERKMQDPVSVNCLSTSMNNTIISQILDFMHSEQVPTAQGFQSEQKSNFLCPLPGEQTSQTQDLPPVSVERKSLESTGQPSILKGEQKSFAQSQDNLTKGVPTLNSTSGMPYQTNSLNNPLNQQTTILNSEEIHSPFDNSLDVYPYSLDESLNPQELHTESTYQPITQHQQSSCIKEEVKGEQQTSTLFGNVYSQDLFGGVNVGEDSFFDQWDSVQTQTEQHNYDVSKESSSQQYTHYEQGQTSTNDGQLQISQEHQFDANYPQTTEISDRQSAMNQYGSYQNYHQQYPHPGYYSQYPSTSESGFFDQSTNYQAISHQVQPVYAQQSSVYNQPFLSQTTSTSGYGDPPSLPYSEQKPAHGYSQNTQYYQPPQIAPPKTPILPQSSFGPAAQIASPPDVYRVQQGQSRPPEIYNPHPRQTSNASSNGSYHLQDVGSGYYTPLTSTFPASPFYPSSSLSPKKESKPSSAGLSFVTAKGGYSSPYDLPPQMTKPKSRVVTTPHSALAFSKPGMPSLLPPPKSLKTVDAIPKPEMPSHLESQSSIPTQENRPPHVQPSHQAKQSLESPFMPSGEAFSPIIEEAAYALPLAEDSAHPATLPSQPMKVGMSKSDYYNPRHHRPPSISEPQISHGYQGDPPLHLSSQMVHKPPKNLTDYKPYGKYGINTLKSQSVQESPQKGQSFGSPPRTLLSSGQKRAAAQSFSPTFAAPPQPSGSLANVSSPNQRPSNTITSPASNLFPQGISDVRDSPKNSLYEGAIGREGSHESVDDYSTPNAAIDNYAPITIKPNTGYSDHDPQQVAEELCYDPERGQYRETNIYKPSIPRVTSPTFSESSIHTKPPTRIMSPYHPDSLPVSRAMSPSVAPISAILSRPASPRPHASSLPSQMRPHLGTGLSNLKSASPLAQEQRPASPFVPSKSSVIPLSSTVYSKSAYETHEKRHPSGLYEFRAAHPLVAFGFGGKLITMFPHWIQRYSADGSSVSKGAPGLMKIANLKDHVKVGELSTFPGPIYQVGASKSSVKAKRKECSFWLQSKISKLEPFQGVETEHKVILFKLLKAYIDHEPPLDGSPEFEASCKEILMPGLSTSLNKNEDSSFTLAADLLKSHHVRQVSEESPLAQYSVSKEFIASIAQLLLKGDQDGAIRLALDNQMWAHAMLIASCVSKDRWKSVVKEFVRTELENAGEGSKSLKVLYEVFAGHGADAVEELLPPSSLLVHCHTQVDTASHLDRWRETLTMILANKTAGDAEAISALGTQLSNFGFTEASHSCFLLSRDSSMFDAVDMHKRKMVLVSASHEKYPFDFFRDLDAIKLTEIYEFIKCNGQNSVPGIPHLQAYKLYYAWILVDLGMTSTAQRYCETIASIMNKSKTCQYYHPTFVSQLQELSSRLMDSPDSYEEHTKGWTTTLSRSKFDKVLGSLEGKFKNFVSGDDEPDGGRRSFEGADTKGPFARIASDTGSLTKVASMSSLRESYALSGSTYGSSSYSAPPQNLTRAVSYGGPQALSHNYLPQKPYEPIQRTINELPAFSPPKQAESYQLENPPDESHTLPRKADLTSQYLMPMRGPPLPAYGSDQVETVDSMKERNVDDEDDLGLNISGRQKVDVSAKEYGTRAKSEESVQVKKEQEVSDKPAAGGWLGRFFGKTAAKQDQGGKVYKAKLGEEMKLVYDEKLKRWVNPNNKDAFAAETPLPPPPKSRSVTPAMEQSASSIPRASKAEEPANAALPGLGNSTIMSAPGSRSASAAPPVSRTNSAPLRHQESIDDLLGVPGVSKKGGTVGRKGAKRYVDVFQNPS